MKIIKITLSIATTLLLSSNLMADDMSDLKAEVAELQALTQALIDESADMQTGFNYTTADNDKSYSGLGGAASKVYYSKSPLSIGGYGEMFYSHTTADNNTKSSKVDVYRFVPYIGYKFSDNIILNTELEFEHGGVVAEGETDIANGVDGGAKGGEVIVEFMYLDFLIDKNFNVRTGNMLMPMGLINERHEPTLFNTVQRPLTAKYLIPSTWNESGIMAYGQIVEGLQYKLAGVTALKPSDAGDKWLRDGRGGSFKNTDPELAIIARVDYTGYNGVSAGASVYNDNDLMMWDIHFDVKSNGARVYATFTQTTRSNAADAQVESANGGYLNASFDVLSLASSEAKLPLFIQYETINPQAELADGTKGDETSIMTAGLNFFPHPQVVLKADYAMSTKNSLTDNTASVSMGFIF